MHWIEVEDHRMPALLAGHPALELCNTWAGWDEPTDPRGEWLPDFDHLAVWAGHAGLLDPAIVPRLRAAGREQNLAADEVLAEVRSLRAALHDVLLDPADGAAFALVATQAQRAAGLAVLEANPDGVARWVPPPGIGPALPLLAVATAAADLLTSTARTQVRACPGEGCGWLFLDPRGRRRWCTMAVCGNRAKVRTYASRR
ncbi:ABATE domain-containing protein [Micromonospora sp. NPDC049523]|uniref:CGNR zinc finger domain-containing protein n=1 Tax=Micromonospora sp. NPDC049523 TaxID=3155921 RepID=UPI0034256F87